MKVKELINALKQYPDDMMVVVSGYEGGFDEINEGSLMFLRAHTYPAYNYCGKYEEVDTETENTIKAVFIS